jgi:hypothetical protein
MTWYSALVLWWHRITSRKANDLGNERDYICEIINSTRKGKWELSRAWLQIGIMEVDSIKYELTEVENKLRELNQDLRIFESLKSKK